MKSLLLCTLLLLTGCSKITLENYDKLKTGMSYEAAIAILGTPSTCDEVLGVKNCRWDHPPSHIAVSFLGGKILLTSAENLH